MGRATPVNVATGAFGGAPYVATKRARRSHNGWGGRMKTLPLWPSVEFPMGPRNVLREGG
eukprot:3434044-Pyramimonas_sp.AAC.1